MQFGHLEHCSKNNNIYKVQQNEAKAYEKLTKRSQKVGDHLEVLGGGGRGGKAWAQRRHIHEKWYIGREGLGWHRRYQEVANHSEGLASPKMILGHCRIIV